ncbi:uncharacterized protein PGTG_12989 [Puccinia graminis f. sp. tritici CRL 75-36-700-3]|uniref:Uncharacterized protein n=1 Tax=Puccinia graminis f. sp. tritici (strain CRL 75-36-700-3 / race SCCL) TaxID=418459 RepID=E3KQN2_PUCGT|nr:uncharacterized protein PGTG_12989 [Puccinia graminis f. sp. tritici CRL 75-36-700-3]EFP86607.1 hypothetical protein PGTG_12989 [Puccinia graminis f. sp. tritici CRL 75-36-700-3]
MKPPLPPTAPPMTTDIHAEPTTSSHERGEDEDQKERGLGESSTTRVEHPNFNSFPTCSSQKQLIKAIIQLDCSNHPSQLHRLDIDIASSASAQPLNLNILPLLPPWISSISDPLLSLPSQPLSTF